MEVGNYWYYENGKIVIGAPGEHVYNSEATCIAKACTICGHVCTATIEHVLDDNCVCTNCGKTYHLFVDGTCSQCGTTADIPDNALTYSGHTYYVFTTVVTWEEAEEYCESRGGDLTLLLTQFHAIEFLIFHGERS